MTPSSQTDAVALLPCPHCGASDCYVERSDFSSCYVVCNDCCARGPTSCNETDEDAEASEYGDCEPGEMPARRRWNRRAPAVEGEPGSSPAAIPTERPAWSVVARLLTALRPFANRAARYDDTDVCRVMDDVELWQLDRNAHLRVDLTVGDLRTARQAHEEATAAARDHARRQAAPPHVTGEGSDQGSNRQGDLPTAQAADGCSSNEGAG